MGFCKIFSEVLSLAVSIPSIIADILIYYRIQTYSRDTEEIESLQLTSLSFTIIACALFCFNVAIAIISFRGERDNQQSIYFLKALSKMFPIFLQDIAQMIILLTFCHKMAANDAVAVSSLHTTYLFAAAASTVSLFVGLCMVVWYLGHTDMPYFGNGKAHNGFTAVLWAIPLLIICFSPVSVATLIFSRNSNLIEQWMIIAALVDVVVGGFLLSCFCYVFKRGTVCCYWFLSVQLMLTPLRCKDVQSYNNVLWIETGPQPMRNCISNKTKQTQ